MSLPCISGGGPRDEGSRSGKCRPCWVRAKPALRFCRCGTQIGPNNKSGLCKPCICFRNHADPDLSLRRVEGTRRSNADPALKAKRAKLCKIACTSPEERQRRSELGKRQHPITIHSPTARERAFSPEAIAKRSQARLATMARKKERDARLDVARKAAIERQAELDALTPFERQLQAIRNGAGIVNRRDYRAEASFSATGVSTIYECG